MMSATNTLAVADLPVCTYGTYYNNEVTDLFGGNYNTVMGDYVVEGVEGVLGCKQVSA